MPTPFLSSEEYDERAHALYNEGKYDEALALLREAVALYPNAVELHVDGRARLVVVRARAGWRDAYLVEYFATQEGVKSSAGHILDAGNNTFRGLRIIGSGSGSPHLEHFESAWWGGDLAYFEFTDVEADWGFERPSFFELYDMLSDPAQLHNVYAAAPVALRDNLAARVRAQYGCVASACS